MAASTGSARLLRGVLARVDFAALGEIYCDHGGEAFWADRRAALEALGARWSAALLRRLRGTGTSFYLGAGIAELPALLTEHVDLGRVVLPVNQRARECEVLNDALGSLVPGLRFRAGDGAVAVSEAAFDHLSCVSVLSDPESFPIASAVSYGRLHAAQVVAADLAAEQARIRALVAAVADRLERPAWITTTVEEVPWFLEWAAQRGLRMEGDEEMVETAIVGDPIGFLRVS